MIKKPRVINLPITEVCDSQCVMCNVWNAGKIDQFTPEGVQALFKQNFFNKVRHIGISGGEPTLNNGLVEICNTLLEVVPKLKTISMTSHGYHYDKHSIALPAIKKACERNGTSFSLNLSLDGVEDIHDKVRRIPHAFDKVTKTAQLAKSLGIHVQFQCTISPVNVYNIIKVREYALQHGFEIVFRIASYIARLSNQNLTERIALNNKQRSFVADFIESERTILAANSLGRRLFYTDLSNRLKRDAPRKAPCSFQTNGLFIAPNQSIFNCSRSEQKLHIRNISSIEGSIQSTGNETILKNLIQHTCNSCYHDQSGRWPLWKYFTVHNQLLTKFIFFKKVLKIPAALLKYALPIRSEKKHTNSFGHALIIGCYGGEHVGDAAILGGVLLRLQKKYNIKKATVISFRPDRTISWINNLHINNIRLDAIEKHDLSDINQYDVLVLAGGPIMSIPLLLANHLSLIRKFKHKEKPFFIEGVGIGPLNSRITKKMAKKIIRSANSISVRTHKDYSNAKRLVGDVNKTFDPAFDYLHQIKHGQFKPHSTLDSLVNTSKEIWIINLRPLWNKYSSKKDELNLLEKKIITSIANFADRFKENRRFIFMPMNADQLGFSDLEIAYRLEKKIKEYSPSIDFKIWEYEPDIDNCVYLIRKSKLVISMRFHGCIFSLANNIPTIGLDYSTSEKGKVYSLFEDFNIQDRVINISQVGSNSLVNLANNILNTHPSAIQQEYFIQT